MKILMRSLIAAGALTAGLALSVHDAAATVVNLTNPNFDANVGLPPNSDNYITATTGTVAIPGWTIVGSGTATSGTLAPMTSGGSYFNGTANWSPPRSAQSAAPRWAASALRASSKTPARPGTAPRAPSP